MASRLAQRENMLVLSAKLQEYKLFIYLFIYLLLLSSNMAKSGDIISQSFTGIWQPDGWINVHTRYVV